MTMGPHRAAGPTSGGDVPAQTATSPREVAATPQPGWVPDGVDITVAASSRVYNCALGGPYHFKVDRQLWARIEHSYPPARWAAHANRAFLARVTRWLAGLGVRQFLDIGAGIPTLDATHETARETDPTARVVYVDIDPVAVEQAKSLLAGDPNARAISGDLRDPEQILTDPAVTALLDFSAPVAVVLGYVLHHIPDDADAAAAVSRIGAALSPGSFLVLSHWTPEATAEGRRQQAAACRLYQETPTPVVLRTADQLAALLNHAVELLPPGIVSAEQWRPDPEEVNDQHSPAVLVAAGRRRQTTPPAENPALVAASGEHVADQRG